jgi:hypothetical protein
MGLEVKSGIKYASPKVNFLELRQSNLFGIQYTVDTLCTDMISKDVLAVVNIVSFTTMPIRKTRDKYQRFNNMKLQTYCTASIVAMGAVSVPMQQISLSTFMFLAVVIYRRTDETGRNKALRILKTQQ